MKFCPGCGTKIEGMKFCPECGYKVESNASISQSSHTNDNSEKTILEFSTYMFGMENMKKNLGKIDISIPQYKYTLTNQRLLANKVGIISTNRDEFELYKIKDITVKQGLKEKVLSVGDITIISTDETSPTYTLKRIKDPIEVKETIRKAMMELKKEMSIGYHQDI